MESFEDELEKGTFVDIVTQFKESVFDSAKSIKSNDETFKISTLPEVGDKLRELISDYTTVMRDIETSQQTFKYLHDEIKIARDANDGEAVSLATFEEQFKQTYDTQRQTVNKQTQALEVLNKILGRPIVRDEDIMEEAPRELQWPKDPITKTNIKKAVRSKQCKHIYDKQSIEDYISQKERARSTCIACPVAGCVNKTLSRDDLEPDDEANNIIHSIQGRA